MPIGDFILNWFKPRGQNCCGDFSKKELWPVPMAAARSLHSSWSQFCCFLLSLQLQAWEFLLVSHSSGEFSTKALFTHFQVFWGLQKLSWVLFNRSIALSEICSISDLVNWKEKYYQVNSKNVSKRVFNVQLSSNIACWTNFYFIDWLGLSYLQLVFIYIIVYNVHDKIMNIFVHISDSLRIIRKCTKCQGKQKYRTIWNCFKNKYVISKYK